MATPAPAPAAPAAAPLPPSPNLVANGSIVATLKASSHFSILAKALDQAQLSGVLGQTPGLTLFAPTDDAFETSKLQLDGSGDVLKVNDADIIEADVVATNGTIHVIDKVLIPADVTLP
jgi:uncharacterized surface protein with fasciclin (FAS1) repeats